MEVTFLLHEKGKRERKGIVASKSHVVFDLQKAIGKNTKGESTKKRIENSWPWPLALVLL